MPIGKDEEKGGEVHCVETAPKERKPWDWIDATWRLCSSGSICGQSAGTTPKHSREGENGQSLHWWHDFVDLVSGFTFVKMQVSLRAGETILAKEEFENIMLDHGATVRKYHGDNGIFVSKAWREHCDDRGQAYDFSGVGAHHQNANAERAIQTVSYWARAMMVNAAIHWPEKGGDQSLWPFAMLYATWLFNRLPGYDTGVTPLELLTQQKSDHADLRRAHVWGAPTYVLDPKLQDDKKIPKWNRRSRRG